MPEKHSHTGYCRNNTVTVLGWNHYTIPVQGIRNDDQSLSPITSLLLLSFLILFRRVVKGLDNYAQTRQRSAGRGKGWQRADMTMPSLG